MGPRLGRYVILKHLASGEMVDVLLARSDASKGGERHVVIKRIRADHIGDKRLVRTFLDEARLAATLHHEHIVQVHEVGESDGEYFLAMAYVHGEDTRRLLANVARQREHVPLGIAIAIVSAAAAGLHHAHERHGNDGEPLDIVHRDVSPSNILIGYDGSITLVDFGIASAAMRPEAPSSHPKGKLSYMSPEQCRGVFVDRRSDIYSLGVVLYELATTTRMIRADSDAAMMEQIVLGRIAPPQSRRPDLPDELVDIVMRALATDRQDRYATADEMRSALEQLAGTAGLVAPPAMIAAYMRDRFGHQPEPSLEPSEHTAVAVEELASRNSWAERSQGDDPRGTGSPPRPSERRVAAVARGAPVSKPPPVGAPVSHPAARRAHPVRTVALIGAVPVALAVIWLLMSQTQVDDTPVAAPSAPVIAAPLPPPPAPPPPAPAPPVPSQPPAPEEIAPVVEDNVKRERTATTRRPRAGASSASSRPRPAVEPAAPKPERPDRVERLERPERAEAVLPELPAYRDENGETAMPVPPPSPSSTAVVSAAPAKNAKAAAPPVVALSVLEPFRIAGAKAISPDSATMDAIERAGAGPLISRYKMCLAADGSVQLVTQLRSSGFPAYDEKIRTTVRRDWRFRPFLVAGKPSPVCTALHFQYSQE